MVPILFNRALLRKRQRRVAADFLQHQFLHQQAAERVMESLSYITHPFETVAELCAFTGVLKPMLAGRAGTRNYHEHLLEEDEHLPFAENSIDAVVSVFSLHWVNDLPGLLTQIRRALKPDGLFMAILPGGESLRELRQVLTQVESALLGGITPRIAPFLDVRDGGALLQRAGFALPVADSETLTITYDNLFVLLHELRGAGESNALSAQRLHFTPRQLFVHAAARYQQDYADSEGRIPATVELITLTGWKPAATQQQPAKRGSGKVSLVNALQ